MSAENVVSSIMSHILLWSHSVLLTVGIYSSYHGVIQHWSLHDEEIQKSAGPFVCNTNKYTYSSIINSRMIRIAYESSWHAQQENEAIFKIIFRKFLTELFKKKKNAFLPTTSALLAVE